MKQENKNTTTINMTSRIPFGPEFGLFYIKDEAQFMSVSVVSSFWKGLLITLSACQNLYR